MTTHTDNKKECTCKEPHISARICHHYDGVPCHVKDESIACTKFHSLSPEEMHDATIRSISKEIDNWKSFGKAVERGEYDDILKDMGGDWQELERILGYLNKNEAEFIKSLISQTERKTIDKIVILVKNNKDPYMFPETEERFIKDLSDSIHSNE